MPAAVWHLYCVFTRLPERILTIPSLYPFAPNTHLHVHESTPRAHTSRQTLTCASPHTHKYTNCRVLCTVARSQDLWQWGLHIQLMLFLQGAKSIQLWLWLLYSGSERKQEPFLLQTSSRDTFEACFGFLGALLREFRPECVYGFHIQVMDSCTVKGSAVAVTETGLRDPLVLTDRVQAQLASSCSFLSHARRKMRAERGGWRTSRTS